MKSARDECRDRPILAMAKLCQQALLFGGAHPGKQADEFGQDIGISQQARQREVERLGQPGGGLKVRFGGTAFVAIDATGHHVFRQSYSQAQLALRKPCTQTRFLEAFGESFAEVRASRGHPKRS